MTSIKIESCRDCRNLQEERDYTEDSFEHCTRGLCKKTNKFVFRYLDWNEKVPPVPQWCPIRTFKKRAKKETK